MTNLNGSSEGMLYITFFSNYPVNIIREEITLTHSRKKEFFILCENKLKNRVLLYKNKTCVLDETGKNCDSIFNRTASGIISVPPIEILHVGTFRHKFTLVNNNITPLSEMEEIFSWEWQLGETVIDHEGLFFSEVPNFEVNYTFNAPNVTTIFNKRLQVNLNNDEYNFSKFMYSSKSPDYIYTQNKITSIVWDLPLDYNKQIKINSMPDKATLEESMDESTKNSERLAKATENLSIIALIISTFSLIITLFLNWNDKEHKPPHHRANYTLLFICTTLVLLYFVIDKSLS